MSFDWRPESKDRYFRKAEAAVKAAGFEVAVAHKHVFRTRRKACRKVCR